MGLNAKSTSESLQHLCKLLDTNKKVYFSRFGDGEIYNMVGKDNNEHYATADLTSEMKESFKIEDPLYLKAVTVNYPIEKGMIYGLFAPFPNNIQLEKVLVDNFNFPENHQFENPVLFHYLTVFAPESMNSFLNKYIRPKKKMFIGSTPQHIAEKIFGQIDVYIPIPPAGAFYTINNWFPEIVEQIDNVEVVIPSAGAASNVISYRLWNMNKEIHCLDIGSIVDAAEGISTRKWIKLMGHRVNNILLPRYQNKTLLFKTKYILKEIWFKLRLWKKGKNYKLPYLSVKENEK
jgi:hypothetical protein